jgi:serine/threonine protein kinase
MKYCTLCKSKYEDSVSFCPTDGEVLEDDPSSIVGTVLDGQYTIESLLGKGGMGAVYLARHILLGDRVAIKILPPEVRNNADWLRRFRREGQAARRLRHANAVAVHDLRTASDGTIYMVMEYVEGQTLDAELKQRGQFSPAETLEILDPIMSVLNTAHSMGVVHRDLKPENIMIAKATGGRESSVKLLDLGIAKMREIAGESTGSTELTMAGQVLGTPYYMSPEQWGELSRDGNPEIDGRADIYSLGLVAYQMISGRRPYTGTTLHELRREHISVNPPPLREKIPDVPQSFSDAIERAIAKDRDDRQSTAGELAAQLRSAVIGGGGGEAAANAYRTVPDIPRAQDSHAHTRGGADGLATKADVNAPTLITVDSVPTSPPSTGLRPDRHHGVPSAVAGAEPQQSPVGNMGSSVTVVRPSPAGEVGQKAGGRSFALIGVGALLVILAVVGVGGFFAIKWWKSQPSVQPGEVATTTGSNSTTSATVAPVEIGRYWLEVLPESLIPKRVAGESLRSGEAFKFHFRFEEGGYLYIIGPGEGNQLTAFLTLYPADISGLESNLVTKAEDFSFPKGLERWMELDKKPGEEKYTIIFSPSPLTEPAFLREPVTRKPLNEEQRSELAKFLAQDQMSKPVTEFHHEGPTPPFVAVKLPTPKEPNESGAPIAFEVRIQHQ